jgi:alkylhydroperoxidase/carboxymuconolactone decarboxylase family protein YurZ
MTGWRKTVLPPDGRAVLVELLRPPPGAELARGIATTFTLDLVSALAAPLSFAGHRLGSAKDPEAIMQAVTMAADRLDIFCQAGQLNVPGKPSDLMAFLEKMVHPVKSPHVGGLFHPKIWLLEFSDGTETSFRFLCASRNLTSDRNWDVVVRLDGTRGSRPLAANRPLRDLVSSLPAWAIQPLPAERTARIQELADSVRYTYWERPDDVGDIAFHALGATRRRSSLDFTGTSHLVISPFATSDGLRRVAPSGSVTKTYVLDDAAALEQPDDTAAARQDLLAGLHAKAYVVERGYDAHVFVGSANATRAAFDGNIEFLVELVGKKSKLGIETLVGADAPFRQMLTDYPATGGKLPSADDVADRKLEEKLRSLATLAFSAAARCSGELYTVQVTTNGPLLLNETITATAELLTRPGDAAPLQEPVDIAFPGIAMVDVTPFLVLRVTDARGESRATVVLAALTGDPPGRHDELLARQIDTPEKFLRLLALMLSLGSAGSLAELTGSSAGSGWRDAGQLGVFETLVRALGAAPAVLADIAPLVERLQRSEKGRQVLPEGFAELWDLVWRARAELAGTSA